VDIKYGLKQCWGDRVPSPLSARPENVSNVRTDSELNKDPIALALVRGELYRLVSISKLKTKDSFRKSKILRATRASYCYYKSQRGSQPSKCGAPGDKSLTEKLSLLLICNQDFR